MSITIGQALRAAQRTIDAVDARVLLCHAVQRAAAYLIAHGDDPLGSEAQRAFEALVARRAAGEPVAYLIGHREFFGLDFRVTPAVLIPRPETELLVELALERIPRDKPCHILDLGTGSGCVAISIARHRPQSRVTATDCTETALAVARENARALAVRNIEFAPGRWFGAVVGRRFDLIVSNPPYVAETDSHLARGDLRFEPHAALIAGPDGFTAIRLIAAQAHEHLAAGGWLLFEHGYKQGEGCRALLEAEGFGGIQSWRDLAGQERLTGGRREAGRLDGARE